MRHLVNLFVGMLSIIALASCNINRAGDSFVDSALEHYRKGELQAAVSDLRQALDRDLAAYHRANVLDLLGSVYLDLELYDSTIAYKRTALRIEPDLDNALVGLGIAYRRMMEYDSASYYYREALKINPKNVDAYISLGTMELLQGRPEAAVIQYEMAVKSDPTDGRAHGNYATGLAHIGEFQRAKDELKLARSYGYEYIEDVTKLVEELRQQAAVED